MTTEEGTWCNICGRRGCPTQGTEIYPVREGSVRYRVMNKGSRRVYSGIDELFISMGCG